MSRVKVIFDESTEAGNNPGDSAMLTPDEAAKVVQAGGAHYETPPKAKTKEAGK